MNLFITQLGCRTITEHIGKLGPVHNFLVSSVAQDHILEYADLDRSGHCYSEKVFLLESRSIFVFHVSMIKHYTIFWHFICLLLVVVKSLEKQFNGMQIQFLKTQCSFKLYILSSVPIK